jgi:hypothetical protein
MKATHSRSEPSFPPVTVSITFESQKELDAFGSLMNCGIVDAAFSSTFGFNMNLYDVFRRAGADINKQTLLANYFKNRC